MCKQDYVFRGLGVTLSGRGRIPEAESPDRHPLIIAIHGGTYSSRYFDVAGYSLLDRAQAQQLPIFAIDRPGYGLSADYAANAPSIMDNAEILDSAIHGLWHSYSHKACGIVLVGHSIGGAITPPSRTRGLRRPSRAGRARSLRARPRAGRPIGRRCCRRARRGSRPPGPRRS